MKKLNLFIISSLLLIISCGQKGDETELLPLATVGDRKISVNEFRTRFEFTPRIYRYGSPIATKKYFLSSMIAEKLLSQIGRDMKLDTSFQIASLIQQREKEAVIETLFEREIDDKLEISEAELKQAYFRSKQELMLKYFVTNDSLEANRAALRMKNGGAFDSVASHYIPFGAKIPTKVLKWGDALQTIEDAVFPLKTGEVSAPVEVDGQFYIFQMANKSADVFYTENDYFQSLPSIKKRIKSQKRSVLFAEYLHSLLKDTKVKISGKTFNYVATELERALEIGEPDDQNPNASTNYLMYHSDFIRARSQFEENLDQPFASFSDGTAWTIREFLTKLWLGPYPLNLKSKKQFRSSLRHTTKFMIELEGLARKGYEQGLHETDYVRAEAQMWGDSFVSTVLERAILDTVSVTEASCLEYYESNKNDYQKPALINIQEILVESKELAERLLKRIQSGEDMATLAKRYSKREISAKDGGISGYFTVGAWGKVGQAAARAKKGELVGPIETENQKYSIFKLIDKNTRGPAPYEEVRKNVREDALIVAKERVMDEYLQSHLNAYPIRINTEQVDSLKFIDTSGSGMMVMKQHFPGRTIAPSVQPKDKMDAWRTEILSAV